jgi:hypothetical protein
MGLRLLFVENRQKTWFWDAVAERLALRGHEIHWVRQNPVFYGETGFSHAISPPHGVGAERSADPWFAEIEASDRHCRNFGGSSGHYSYYRDRLRDILESVQPHVTIGESTLFHELILIKLCRERGIEYLNPVSARYPDGRFFVMRYDSQRVISGSGERLPEEQAREIARSIAERTTLPYYMRPSNRIRAMRKWISLRLGHARLLAGWLAGERFNTPSPWRRLSVGWQIRCRLQRWDELARPLAERQRAILYPLQMQPECNIDVWGRMHNDQTRLVGALLERAPREVVVAVKGNPKPKCEVSDDLLALAARERRLVLLPRQTAMADAQRSTLGSVTVTGTVGFEAIFGSARCFSLAHPLITDEFPTFAARDVAEAVELVLGTPNQGRGDVGMGASLIQRFVEQSFPGVVSDPTSHPEVMEVENVAAVSGGLDSVLSSWGKRPGIETRRVVGARE